jgi:trimethylamine--corrinoid protein Co-methyltransferase
MYQFFYRLYGIRIGLCCGYTDAEVPGLKAVNDKMLKSLAYGWFTDRIGGQAGSLGAGNIYSPTQQVLDLDMNRQTAQLARGITVNEETLAVDLIERLAASEDGVFLTEDHTLKHWREALWIPELMTGVEPRTGGERQCEGDRIVARAERKWRDALAAYDPPALDEGALRAAEKVAEEARKALLTR